MVLAALGVVKVATAGQIRRLMCPGTAGAQTVRNGCRCDPHSPPAGSVDLEFTALAPAGRIGRGSV